MDIDTILEDFNVNRLMKTKNLILLTILFGAVFMSLTTPCLATNPPSAGMVVWFKADAGVTQDTGGVSVWEDQSGHANHANRVLGGPQPASATFPNGSHAVLRFNGDDGLRLTNAAATQLTSFNIFIVASYDAGSATKRIFGNYSYGSGATQYGYAFGTTGAGAPDWWYAGSSELSTGAPYEADRNYLTVYTLKDANQKDLYNFHEEDGFAGHVAETAASPIQYYSGSDPNIPPQNSDIGVLWIDLEGYGWYGAHTGDIAEILVYNLADPAYIALNDPNAAFDDVRAYVTEKYGMDTTISSGPGVEPDPDINADLVAYWPFEETAGDVVKDKSGNDNDGTLMGGFTFDSSSAANRLGNPTGALTFNGSSDWIHVAHDTTIDCFPQVTIAAWVKSGTQKAYAELVSKELAVVVGGNYRAYLIMVHSNQSVMSWMANAANPTYVGNTTGTADGVAVGEWHFIAVTHDGTGITLYLDGLQDGLKVPMTGLESTASAPLFIGKGPDEFGDRHWTGDVDEIAIWNAALTPGNILSVYENGFPLPPPGCKEVGKFFPTDFNQDCYVNLEDFAVIAQDWLKCNDPQRPECTDIP
jgi:hypothetical protein